MPKKTAPNEGIAEALRDARTTVSALRDIEQVYVCRFSEDASSAMRAGAVLLGVARVDNDEEGDGFRCLIGLPKGTRVSRYLSNYFHE